MAITSATLTANDTVEHFYDATLSENEGLQFLCSGTFGTANVVLEYEGTDGLLKPIENGGPFTALASKEVKMKRSVNLTATMAGATGGESVYIEIADLARG